MEDLRKVCIPLIPEADLGDIEGILLPAPFSITGMQDEEEVNKPI